MYYFVYNLKPLLLKLRFVRLWLNEFNMMMMMMMMMMMIFCAG